MEYNYIQIGMSQMTIYRFTLLPSTENTSKVFYKQYEFTSAISPQIIGPKTRCHLLIAQFYLDKSPGLVFVCGHSNHYAPQFFRTIRRIDRAYSALFSK